MDFSFNPDHLELADALTRWLASHYQLPQRQQAISTGTDPLWPLLADMGVTALAVDEAHGGLGQGAADLLPVLQALGAALAITPLCSTATAARALAWAGRPALQQQLLPGIADGSVRMALAFGERASRHELHRITTELRLDASGGYSLHGAKSVVLFAAEATHWLVSARLHGELALLMLPADATHTTRQCYRTYDSHPAAELRFEGTPVQPDALLDAGEPGGALLERTADYGATLLCAEAVGLMQRSRDDTLAHLQTRHQFGAPLASFQALQHRMVEVTMQLEQARSISYLAAAHADSADAAERIQAVSAAKALVGEAGLFVGRQCVQLHGALGLTDEMPVSHALKRLSLIDQTLGDADQHLMRFAARPAFAD